VIHRAIHNWNSSNDRKDRSLIRVQEAEKDLEISVNEERESFCLLVEVKKGYGVEVSDAGRERYDEECGGLVMERQLQKKHRRS